ncbi:transposable element Tcb2 transposase [Trichonephila clavipes]|uniref:Transposable element Tcb2 transposase n=1 Tax=Trichonephila clavipes TaxID=2585209 RepID=A0A8X6RVW3_TRICX|nr:transposable element Tcb2 transposase [Trichonephila clavipes]
MDSRLLLRRYSISSASLDRALISKTSSKSSKSSSPTPTFGEFDRCASDSDSFLFHLPADFEIGFYCHLCSGRAFAMYPALIDSWLIRVEKLLQRIQLFKEPNKENLRASAEKLGIEKDYHFCQDNDPKHSTPNTKPWLDTCGVYWRKEAWRVVGRLEGGQTQAEVAQAIGVSQSVISRIWSRFLETESAGRRPGQGRRRATTPNEDRFLVLTARRHRNMNTTLLQQHLRSATGTTVSTQTVRNRLHGVGLYARRSMVCVRLTSWHHRHHRKFIFIWRDRGSRNNPAFVHKSVRFGGGGVLVYGGISIDGRTDLYIIQDGPLTARRYKDEILRTIVVPYAAAIGNDFILMDDNCWPHRANLVEDFFLDEGIVRMEWTACSPGLNPIEHVWDTLGIRVSGRQPPPQILQEQERALLEP